MLKATISPASGNTAQAHKVLEVSFGTQLDKDPGTWSLCETRTSVASGMILGQRGSLYQEAAARTVGGPGFPWITSVPITTFGAYTFQVLSSRLKPGCAETAIDGGLMNLLVANAK